LSVAGLVANSIFGFESMSVFDDVIKSEILSYPDNASRLFIVPCMYLVWVLLVLWQGLILMMAIDQVGFCFKKAA
jgi:hypothetical protein